MDLATSAWCVVSELDFRRGIPNLYRNNSYYVKGNVYLPAADMFRSETSGGQALVEAGVATLEGPLFIHLPPSAEAQVARKVIVSILSALVVSAVLWFALPVARVRVINENQEGGAQDSKWTPAIRKIIISLGALLTTAGMLYLLDGKVWPVYVEFFPKGTTFIQHFWGAFSPQLPGELGPPKLVKILLS